MTGASWCVGLPQCVFRWSGVEVRKEGYIISRAFASQFGFVISGSFVKWGVRWTMSPITLLLKSLSKGTKQRKKNNEDVPFYHLSKLM